MKEQSRQVHDDTMYNQHGMEFWENHNKEQ